MFRFPFHRMITLFSVTLHNPFGLFLQLREPVFQYLILSISRELKPVRRKLESEDIHDTVISLFRSFNGNGVNSLFKPFLYSQLTIIFWIIFIIDCNLLRVGYPNQFVLCIQGAPEYVGNLPKYTEIVLQISIIFPSYRDMVP